MENDRFNMEIKQFKVKIVKKSKLTKDEIKGLKELVNYPDSTVIEVEEFPKILKIRYYQKRQIRLYPPPFPNENKKTKR